MIVAITRGFVNRETRIHHQTFVQNNQPSDLQQIEYFRNRFPRLRIAQIFQIFQILNSREASVENQFRNLRSQIQNTGSRMSTQVTRTQNQVY